MLLEKIQLEPNEEVLKTVRKHWFIIFAQLLGTFFFILLPFLIIFMFAVFPQTLMTENISLTDYTKYISFGMTAWTLIMVMVGFSIWTHYYLDLWIITDRRIISVDQVAFFSRNVSIFRLERLQDIEFTINGLIPTLLNFGTIQAQTAAASESNFKTSGLPDPRNLQAIIQKAMDKRLALLHHNPDLSE